MPRFFTAALLGASFVPWVAHGGALTFNLSGTVTRRPIDDLATVIQSGDAITGSFTLDPTTVDAIAAPSSRSYTSVGPAFGMTWTIGAGAVLFLLSGSLNVEILNRFFDQNTVTASSPSPVLDLFFQNSTAAALSSDGLPLSRPSLAGPYNATFVSIRPTFAGAISSPRIAIRKSP